MVDRHSTERDREREQGVQEELWYHQRRFQEVPVPEENLGGALPSDLRLFGRGGHRVIFP